MKTSTFILCAVVVAVLGLSAALSAQQASETRGYPGDSCGKEGISAANIVRNGWGAIVNPSTTASLNVTCAAPNLFGRRTEVAVVSFTNRSPNTIIICDFMQVLPGYFDGRHQWSIHRGRTEPGGSENLQNITIFPEADSATTALVNFLKCGLPPATAQGAVSELHSYFITEGPLPVLSGISPAIPPSDEQARQARAAIETREMRLEQAITTEKEDPEWSQKETTSWTQVFQKKGVKEEHKGIQLDSIECRTTICRVKLVQTKPEQGNAVFEQDFAQFIPLAPLPAHTFGTMEHPNGQAPRAVLYIAREGHRLP